MPHPLIRSVATLTLASCLVAIPAAHAHDGGNAPTSGEGATMGSSAAGPVPAPSAAAEAAHGPYGVDTSGYTTVDDWSWFTDHSAEFAWIKATEGTYLATDSFAGQWRGATEQGMYRGAYHFANPEVSSGAEQAEFFVRHRGGWNPDGRTLPGALDMEYNPYGGMCYGKSQQEMDRWVRDFVRRYEQLTGVKPVIYTNAHWWNTCVGHADYSDVPLWLARYGSEPGEAPWAWSEHGATHTIWQQRPIEHMGYDVNRFKGTSEDLARFALQG